MMKILQTIVALCVIAIVGSFAMSIYSAVQNKKNKEAQQGVPTALPAGQGYEAPAVPGGVPVPASP